MNLLSLINPWSDIICQVTTKYATVPKSKFFLRTKHNLKEISRKVKGVNCMEYYGVNDLKTKEECTRPACMHGMDKGVSPVKIIRPKISINLFDV